VALALADRNRLIAGNVGVCGVITVVHGLNDYIFMWW